MNLGPLAVSVNEGPGSAALPRQCAAPGELRGRAGGLHPLHSSGPYQAPPAGLGAGVGRPRLQTGSGHGSEKEVLPPACRTGLRPLAGSGASPSPSLAASRWPCVRGQRPGGQSPPASARRCPVQGQRLRNWPHNSALRTPVGVEPSCHPGVQHYSWDSRCLGTHLSPCSPTSAGAGRSDPSPPPCPHQPPSSSPVLGGRRARLPRGPLPPDAGGRLVPMSGARHHVRGPPPPQSR